MTAIMGNSARSMPRKPLCGKGSSFVSILLYDKEFPIIAVIGNKHECGKLSIFQDSKNGGRQAENWRLTPLQSVNKISTCHYSESVN